MTTATQETVGQWLEKLATTNSSSDQDSDRMEKLLKRCGLHSARVVVGVVYQEGQGQPIDIHTMARELVKRAAYPKITITT